MAVVALRPSAGLPQGEIGRSTTPYNDVIAIRSGSRIDLEVEGATFATWHPDRLFTGYSWDALAAGCLLGARAPRSVLLLGLGGGTVARQLRLLVPTVEITGVEIDPGIVRLARAHMGLDDLNVDVVVGDAYRYLADTKQRFDVVIDDLFLTGSTDVVRTRTPQGETLALLQSRLEPGGILVANLITDEGEHAAVRAATRAAFVAAFPSVRAVTPPRGLNEILVAGDFTAPRSALNAYLPFIPDPSDRLRFAELTVRRLAAPPAASSSTKPQAAKTAAPNRRLKKAAPKKAAPKKAAPKKAASKKPAPKKPAARLKPKTR